MSARFLVTLTVDGDKLPRPGSERHEELRAALWEAFDEVEVWIEDSHGEEQPYAVTVTGVGVDAARAAKP